MVGAREFAQVLFIVLSTIIVFGTFAGIVHGLSKRKKSTAKTWRKVIEYFFVGLSIWVVLLMLYVVLTQIRVFSNVQNLSANELGDYISGIIAILTLPATYFLYKSFLTQQKIIRESKEQHDVNIYFQRITQFQTNFHFLYQHFIDHKPDEALKKFSDELIRCSHLVFDKHWKSFSGIEQMETSFLKESLDDIKTLLARITQTQILPPIGFSRADLMEKLNHESIRISILDYYDDNISNNHTIKANFPYMGNLQTYAPENTIETLKFFINQYHFVLDEYDKVTIDSNNQYLVSAYAKEIYRMLNDSLLPLVDEETTENNLKCLGLIFKMAQEFYNDKVFSYLNELQSLILFVQNERNQIERRFPNMIEEGSFDQYYNMITFRMTIAEKIVCFYSQVTGHSQVLNQATIFADWQRPFLEHSRVNSVFDTVIGLPNV